MLVVLTVPMLAQADPADAVVRLRIPIGKSSSWGSGTVIQAGQAHSLILTAAHLWSDEQERPDPWAFQRLVVIEGPAPVGQARSENTARLIGLDYQADLALIELTAVLPYECKVAPRGAHALHVMSVGYDQGCGFPGVRLPATSMGTSAGWTWTREIPREGRSGGGLLDTDTGLLVGVCHGYRTDPGHQAGMYVPLDTIWAFLDRYTVRGGARDVAGAGANNGVWSGKPVASPPAVGSPFG
jgi:hypothetical protein